MLWGVAVWRLIVAVAIVFLGFAARRIIQVVFRGALKRRAAASSAEWDDELVKFMPAPLGVLAQIAIWFGAIALLQLPKEPVDVQRYVYHGLAAALWFAVAWVGMRLVDVLCGVLDRLADKTETRLDDQLVPMARKTLKVVIVATVIIMLVQRLGYSASGLIASLGVGGLALALAAKDTIANLFGSVVVFTDQPFQVGDWVEFAGVEGTVEEVGFRTTLVRRFDKSAVTVPNSIFATTPIVNHSRRPIRRISTTIGVGYEAKAGQIRELVDEIRELIASHPDIDQGFHFVHFTGFGDSTLNVQIYCFTKSTVWTEFLAAQEDLLLQIMALVERKGLELAFPTRTVYLRDEHWNPTASSAA